jgi:CTP synthase (UTP-ammonia lyase)
VYKYMGNFFSNCKQKDLKVETIFGSCGCAESMCSCFASAKEEDEMTRQIAVALRVELANIEFTMKQAIIANIKRFGVMPQINVLDVGAKLPSPKINTLSVQVNVDEPEEIRVADFPLELPEVI